MSKTILAVILIIFCTQYIDAQNVDIRTTNVNVSSELTFDVQIKASSSSFILGGKYNSGRGGGSPGQNSVIDLVIQTYDDNLDNAGDMSFNSISWNSAISSNYIISTGTGDLGGGQGYLDLIFTGQNGGTLQTITTTWFTVGTVTLNLAAGTTTSNTGTVSIDPSFTDIYDDNNTTISNGTFTNTATNNVTLPVDLTFFKASPLQNSFRLEWATSAEENNEGFEVQRSYNGRAFETIGFVEGNGTTLESHSYSFIDDNYAKTGEFIYYRLRQVDFNGDYEFSPTVTVELGEANDLRISSLRVFPNPNSNGVVNFENADSKNLSIYSATGSLVKQYQNVGSQLHTDLPAGLYWIKSDQSQEVTKFRILK